MNPHKHGCTCHWTSKLAWSWATGSRACFKPKLPVKNRNPQRYLLFVDARNGESERCGLKKKYLSSLFLKDRHLTAECEGVCLSAHFWWTPLLFWASKKICKMRCWESQGAALLEKMDCLCIISTKVSLIILPKWWSSCLLNGKHCFLLQLSNSISFKY